MMFVAILSFVVLAAPALAKEKGRERGKRDAKTVSKGHQRAGDDHGRSHRNHGRSRRDQGHCDRADCKIRCSLGTIHLRNRHVRYRWVHGHYETRYKRILVEEAHYETHYIAPVVVTRRDRCGRFYKVTVEPARYEEVWVPDRYETRAVQVWVHGYYVRVKAPGGRRHTGFSVSIQL